MLSWGWLYQPRCFLISNSFFFFFPLFFFPPPSNLLKFLLVS